MDVTGRESCPTPPTALVRPTMGGVFVPGGCLASIGALLPVWVYYVHSDLATAGHYFLALSGGMVVALMLARRVMKGLSLPDLLGWSCVLGGVSVLMLAPILSSVVLIAPLLSLGLALGMLAAGVCRLLLEALTPSLAATVLTLAGACFGTGAVGFVLWIWASVHSLPAPTILIFAALPLLAVGFLCLDQKPPVLPAAPANSKPLSLRQPAAALLAIALVCQFGSQWAAGGWLALYWIRRLGVSSTTALIGLALYWITLTLGVLLAARTAPLARPLRSLTVRFAASMFGSMLLLSTAGVGGAVAGVLFLGAGIGASGSQLLGLIAEQLPCRQPRVFRGLFCLALVGGLLAPATTGYLAHFLGIEWAIDVPALGAVMVYVLLSAVLLQPSAARIRKTVSSN